MLQSLSLHIDVDMWRTICTHYFHTFQSNDVAVAVLLLVVAAAIVPVLLHIFTCSFIFREQNLRKKYCASWALVTGASSGIGKALAERLLQQGMNVCLVALGDDVFKGTIKELEQKYPLCEVRGIFADLSSPAFMPNLIEHTKDITPQVVINNAGYIITGFFADSTLDAQIKNAETNAMSCIRITHHFLNKMLDSGVRGCIGFTSSPSGMIPCPSSVMYGCTKAFLTEFGMSLAGEVYSSGIDVLVVHPSPTTGNSRFYDANKSSKLAAVEFFRKTGGSPSSIASCFLKGFGRTVVFDQGYFSLGAKLGLKLLDISLLALIIQRVTHLGGDFKKLYKERKAKLN